MRVSVGEGEEEKECNVLMRVRYAQGKVLFREMLHSNVMCEDVFCFVIDVVVVAVEYMLPRRLITGSGPDKIPLLQSIN